MITHNVLIGYFEQLAKNYAHIKGFMRVDMAELQGALRTGVEMPVLMVESHEGDYGPSGVLNTQENLVPAFMVLMPVPQFDYDAQNAALDACETHGKAILARIRYDAAKPGHFLHEKVKMATVKYHPVKGIFHERLYGYRFTFEIEEKAALKVSPADWADIDTAC